MEIPMFQVDAFADRVFGGNPAAVCLLKSWLDVDTLLKIAQENNLAETAFLSSHSDPDTWNIRWFTPEIEMDLCGHATLASAHVIFELNPLLGRVTFFSEFSGRLVTLDEVPPCILAGMGKMPTEVWKARDFVLLYDSEATVQALKPNQKILDEINLDPGGVIATSLATSSEDTDFVSRYFTPQSTIFEDPVTGSAHCTLVPLWAQKLGKLELRAKQISQRGGKILCLKKATEVLIQGQAITYLKG
eukprot:maker-scaffold120_size336265-snap-gene-0.7 protein:Tk08783 transcript:maker-scaffold120_size336265-snap-gene-0.7-mRNA-1 annotation:"phenazine biosynthesis protein family protein"